MQGPNGLKLPCSSIDTGRGDGFTTAIETYSRARTFTLVAPMLVLIKVPFAASLCDSSRSAARALLGTKGSGFPLRVLGVFTVPKIMTEKERANVDQSRQPDGIRDGGKACLLLKPVTNSKGPIFASPWMLSSSDTNT